ncbi:hypothetical protein A5698_24510 [Mycobacterium sp. E136]|uniref:hypothetical protein n=1 Tax=Mycobacterium sp. E136 TaxID=1834125 RepID=UPI0007FF7C93|nr:hypothetical protein [Mycobacterium sp. E136]OBG88307.1 hypothetical protein A5698_24510 [Mycobacterium sp. E136]
MLGSGGAQQNSAGVAEFEQYVLACQCLGYRHPDLTAHAGQVRDWYAAEDGLDLGALETDCAAMQSVARAAEDALARLEAQLDTLSTAWQGAGASASREFLRRHGQAATVAATAVRTAASALAELRERLWTAVDDKVAKVTAIGDGVQARRADWLAAAQTVTTGAGDRAVASELVDHEVKPFVDTVVGGDWLAAMRAATDAIEAAYEAVMAQLAPETGAVFDVPGQLGPADTTPPPPAPGVAPAPVTPAGWAAPAAVSPPLPAAPSPPLPAAPPPVPAAPPPLPAAPPPPTEPAASALPSLGGGVPDLGGAFSGFGQQLSDLIGGLLGEGALDGELDDPTQSDAEELAEDNAEELAEDTEEDEDEEKDEEDGAELEEPTVEEPVCAAAPAEVAEAPVEEPPAATVPPEPPVPQPLAPLEPLAAPAEPPTAGTPCEIAADELPQVGE